MYLSLTRICATYLAIDHCNCCHRSSQGERSIERITLSPSHVIYKALSLRRYYLWTIRIEVKQVWIRRQTRSPLWRRKLRLRLANASLFANLSCRAASKARPGSEPSGLRPVQIGACPMPRCILTERPETSHRQLPPPRLVVGCS